jgi:hypothetical protein
MGVAVGRVQSKAGLRVKNFNKGAVTLKHPSYQFQCRRHFHSPRLYHQPGLMLKVELEE